MQNRGLKNMLLCDQSSLITKKKKDEKQKRSDFQKNSLWNKCKSKMNNCYTIFQITLKFFPFLDMFQYFLKLQNMKKLLLS